MGVIELQAIAVVGAGIMGRGIAQSFATADVGVLLCDRSVELAASGKAAIRASLSVLIEAGHLPEGDADRVLARVRVSADLGAAARGASLVVEAVPEDMELKKSVLTEIAAVAPRDSIIATNTSSFDLDDLSEAVAEPRRFIGTHWYNPAYLVPCVELVRCEATSDETLEATRHLLSAAGKEPIVVANSAGFIGNRLQFAMIAEAFRCLDEGVASAEDIDHVVRSSFGPRLVDFGPLRLADLGGLDTYRSVLRYLTSKLGERYTPPILLDRLVDEGRLGVKSGAGVFAYSKDERASLLRERDLKLAERVDGLGRYQAHRLSREEPEPQDS